MLGTGTPLRQFIYSKVNCLHVGEQKYVFLLPFLVVVNQHYDNRLVEVHLYWFLYRGLSVYCGLR